MKEFMTDDYDYITQLRKLRQAKHYYKLFGKNKHFNRMIKYQNIIDEILMDKGFNSGFHTPIDNDYFN